MILNDGLFNFNTTNSQLSNNGDNMLEYIFIQSNVVPIL